MGRSGPRIGIAGVGYWGKNLLRTFSHQPDVLVTHLCDLNDASLTAARAEHPGITCTRDFETLLADAGVDAVVVATPPSRHHAMALAALDAGKHVWIEKPLALAAAQGRQLVAAAERAGRILFVDHTFLFDPLVGEMKRLVDGGVLGEVVHLSFERLGMGRIRRDSDVWWNSAPHDLSILFHLVPRPLRRCRLHRHAHLQPGIADIAVGDLELDGGVSAHVHLSWLHPEKTAKVIVVGRERMLGYEGRFEKRALTLYDYALDPGAGTPTDGAAPIIPVSHFTARPLEVPAGTEPLALAAAHFVECIRSGAEPITSGRRMLPVVEALERAEREASDGGTIG